MNREKTIVRTSIIGIVGNVLLVGFKAFIGILANSVAIITDAINNLTDAGSSIATIIGTKISKKKADKNHPFGHGRVEYITSIIVAALIFVAGGSAITQSINALINGDKPEYDVYAYIIIGGAILVKVALAILFKINGKKANSQALRASGTDALFDAILSTGTLVAAIIASIWQVYIEGYVGIVIGLFIIKSGIDVLREAFSSIIGERSDSELVKNIKDDIKAIPSVLGVYDLVLNEYGPEKMIGSVHIEVPDDLSAKDIYEITTKVQAVIYAKYSIGLTVGIYAANESDPLSKEMKGFLKEAVKEYPNILEVHGFYLAKEDKICKFDLVISFDEAKPYDLIAKVSELMKEKYPEYTYYINLDNDITD